ncbi:MAG: Holliday junction branch migration protein RuvA [Gammaproteobacteria bacterium]|jgi:Holliday junction DNA helicase RuvA|nr:Holliday junction branch migration protein RuvA [Gammaproteobacteria bacterium]
MIGRITGTLLGIEHQTALVDVGGVGYEIECPISTLCELPPVGQTVTLLTHFVVREDAQLLYGFLTHDDRESFRILIKISGVGPKLAIGVLSGLSGDELAAAVERDDVATLTRLPGVGKKTAERLLVELRGRMTSTGRTQSSNAVSPVEEAVLGLIALGYKEAEARKAINALPKDPEATPESLIRSSLKQMLKTP